MRLLITQILLQLGAAFTIEGRALHNLRVSVKENKLDGFPILDNDEAFPNLLPVSIDADGTPIAKLQLSRFHKAERGFPIVAMNGEFETIPAHAPENAAIYRDRNAGAIFGVRMNADGKREYEGSFQHGHGRWLLSQDQSKKRSTDGSPAYRLTRVAVPSHTSFALPSSAVDKGPALNKRASYAVEIGILVDYTEYKYWLDTEGSDAAATEAINYKFSYTLAGVEEAYKTLDGISVTPYITKVVINSVASESPGASIGLDPESTDKQYVNSKDLLGAMASAASGVGLVAGSDVDVAFIWARYDLCDDASDPTNKCGAQGVAYTGGVCSSSQGYGAIEDKGFESWRDLAHEVGHSLGADHDGDGNSCGAGYIMYPVSVPFPDPSSGINVHQFSSCTSEKLQSTVPGKSCLGNDGSDALPSGVDPDPGAKYDTNKQCKESWGTDSTFVSPDVLPDPYGYAMKDICWKGMFCAYGGGAQSGVEPAEGTDCGDGKTCQSGVCT